eukprot:5134978-Amphidinium_carterae.1
METLSESLQRSLSMFGVHSWLTWKKCSHCARVICCLCVGQVGVWQCCVQETLERSVERRDASSGPCRQTETF